MGNRVKTDATVLKRLLADGHSKPEIAKALGVTTGALRTALRMNEMTKVMSVACEGLCRRKNSTKRVLLAGDPESVEKAAEIARLMGCVTTDIVR